jgi:hypothetical protein
VNRCTKFAGYATGEVYECHREAGHDGPCAAELVAPKPCGATWDFYVTDRTLTTYSVTCSLPLGHDLDHRGEIGWPS